MGNGVKLIFVGSLRAVPFLGTLIYFTDCFTEKAGNAAKGAAKGASDLMRGSNDSNFAIAGLMGGLIGGVGGALGEN